MAINHSLRYQFVTDLNADQLLGSLGDSAGSDPSWTGYEHYSATLPAADKNQWLKVVETTTIGGVTFEEGERWQCIADNSSADDPAAWIKVLDTQTDWSLAPGDITLTKEGNYVATGGTTPQTFTLPPAATSSEINLYIPASQTGGISLTPDAADSVIDEDGSALAVGVTRALTKPGSYKLIPDTVNGQWYVAQGGATGDIIWTYLSDANSGETLETSKKYYITATSVTTLNMPAIADVKDGEEIEIYVSRLTSEAVTFARADAAHNFVDENDGISNADYEVGLSAWLKFVWREADLTWTIIDSNTGAYEPAEMITLTSADAGSNLAKFGVYRLDVQNNTFSLNMPDPAEGGYVEIYVMRTLSTGAVTLARSDASHTFPDAGDVNVADDYLLDRPGFLKVQAAASTEWAILDTYQG